MEETNFVLLWKEQYEKIDQSLVINKRLLAEVVNQKAVSVLQSLSRFKSRGIKALVIYLILLGMVLFYAITHYSSAANYFIVSMGAIFLINVKALYDYIRHLVWINNIQYDGSITGIQEKLTKLQLSIHAHNRIMVLQFPFWTTFYLTDKWFPHAVNWGYLTFQFLYTASFIFLAYWLYRNQKIENADQKWSRVLMKSSGGKYVIKAMEFYKEIEAFKQDRV